MHFDPTQQQLYGTAGSLVIDPDDEVARKLVMLILGECTDLGPAQAASLFGLSRQRYYQLYQAFAAHGSAGLSSKAPGPKPGGRCPDEPFRQFLRFLDPGASAEVIAQKLQQVGQPLSTRAVQRLIQHYGLEKNFHRCRPGEAPPVLTQRSKTRRKEEPAGPP
jgi:hypothetical protein